MFSSKIKFIKLEGIHYKFFTVEDILNRIIEEILTEILKKAFSRIYKNFKPRVSKNLKNFIAKVVFYVLFRYLIFYLRKNPQIYGKEKFKILGGKVIINKEVWKLIPFIHNYFYPYVKTPAIHDFKKSSQALLKEFISVLNNKKISLEFRI